MLYLLDTNVIAIYLNQRSLLLRERLERISPAEREFERVAELKIEDWEI